MVSVPYEEEYMGHTIRVRPADRKLRVDGVVLDEYDGRVFDQQLLDEVKMRLRNKELSKSVSGTTTVQDYVHVATLHGADDIEVYEDKSASKVDVCVSGISDKSRAELCKNLVANSPAGVAVEVISKDTEQPCSTSSEEVYQINDPNPIQVKENDSRAVQRDSEDAVKAAKKAYVDGEIGEMELEKRLEEAIEVPHDFTADTL